MDNRIDERKVSKYLYEISGRAGDICGHNKLSHEPEYNKATWLYLTLSDTELESRIESTRENACHPCGTPIQWDSYCRIDERAYKREYLKSDEWKRKRDAVMKRAMFKAAFNGISISGIPICENDGCTNESTQVHHITYERIGKEELDDLQALCGGCHVEVSNAKQDKL